MRDEQPDLPGIPPAPKPRGRPKVHKDAKAAQRAASKAYRDRKRAERQAQASAMTARRKPADIEDHGVIDLSVIPTYRVRKE